MTLFSAHLASAIPIPPFAVHFYEVRLLHFPSLCLLLLDGRMSMQNEKRGRGKAGKEIAAAAFAAADKSLFSTLTNRRNLFPALLHLLWI